ncbi:MAG: hypothetical protein U1F27_16840 [Turneriella sp.]
MSHRYFFLFIAFSFAATVSCRKAAPKPSDTSFVQKELLRFFSPGLHEDRAVVGLWIADKKGLAAMAEAKLRRAEPGLAMSRAAGELTEAAASPEMFIRVSRGRIFRTMLILPDKVKLEFGKLNFPREEAGGDENTDAPKEETKTQTKDDTKEEFDGLLQNRDNVVPVKFVVYKNGNSHRLFYYEGNHRIEARREYTKPEDIIARYQKQFSKLDTLLNEN